VLKTAKIQQQILGANLKLSFSCLGLQ